MAFGLYFEVPAKKIEISKKKYSFGPDFYEKWQNWRFRAIKFKISRTTHDILIL